MVGQKLRDAQAQNQRLRKALRSLRNEAAGCLNLSGVREAIGNSNYACLEQRIREAEAALDESERGTNDG